MNSRLALITFLDGGGGGQIDNTLPTPPVYPGYGLPVPGGPVDPGYGQGHPRPNRPDNSLPYPPHYPSQGLPFPPVTPDNTLPPGPPPSLSLPIVLPTPPPTGPGNPNQRFELKYSPMYGWVLVPVVDETPEPK